MKKSAIHLSDIQRILQGVVPLEFYVELAIRSLFVYLLITFGIKYMGRRISTEISRSELAAISSVAAATGLVIMAPDRGLLPAVAVMVAMIGVKALLDWMAYRNSRFQRMMQGHYSTLVQNGVLQLKEMKKTRISREQLFTQARKAQLMHIGNIERLYMEANGSFTIINSKEKKAGLTVVPEWDTPFLDELPRDPNVVLCCKCGQVKTNAADACTNCGNKDFMQGVKDPE